MDNEKNITEKKRILNGKVISTKMEKTATVEISRTYRHKLVDKVIKSKKKYKVHDEKQECIVGDVVEIYEGRPVSKTKYMYLYKIVSRKSEGKEI